MRPRNSMAKPSTNPFLVTKSLEKSIRESSISDSLKKLLLEKLPLLDETARIEVVGFLAEIAVLDEEEQQSKQAIQAFEQTGKFE